MYCTFGKVCCRKGNCFNLVCENGEVNSYEYT